MKLWRISNYTDLSGAGGLRNSGRWHTKGRPIIYTADHPAGALNELLVHINWEDIPETFQLMTIEVEDRLLVASIEPHQLPTAWMADVPTSRALGDNWLTSGANLLLRVPSAIIPGAHNISVNPTHRDIGKLRITKIENVPLDRRLAAR